METHPRLEKILALLAQHNHRFVSFRFQKKDGTARAMLVRLELAEQLATRYPFNAAKKGLLPVRDLVLWKKTRDLSKSSRFVNCGAEVTVKAGGKTYTF